MTPKRPPIAATFRARITLRGENAAPPTVERVQERIAEALTGYGLEVRVTAERVDK